MGPNPDRAPTRTGPQPGLGPNPDFGNLLTFFGFSMVFSVLLVPRRKTMQNHWEIIPKRYF